MSREKILLTKTSSDAANQLKNVMLAYHDFCTNQPCSSLTRKIALVTKWQSDRLKQTHCDLYESPEYAKGLQFLLSDLYSEKDFGNRDRDLERIFPKIIALMPKSVINTVALLVELNLLTKKLDFELAAMHFSGLEQVDISQKSYCEAYRKCDNKTLRSKQIELIAEVGRKLDKYARSSLVHFSLKVSEAPAEIAGLEALHSFIMQGFSAFHSMENVGGMMQTLVQREYKILNNIYQSNTHPFDLTSNE